MSGLPRIDPVAVVLPLSPRITSAECPHCRWTITARGLEVERTKWVSGQPIPCQRGTIACPNCGRESRMPG